jgi:hypothetical protein
VIDQGGCALMTRSAGFLVPNMLHGVYFCFVRCDDGGDLLLVDLHAELRSSNKH